MYLKTVLTIKGFKYKKQSYFKLMLYESFLDNSSMKFSGTIPPYSLSVQRAPELQQQKAFPKLVPHRKR